jgi:hypothetical protein
MIHFVRLQRMDHFSLYIYSIAGKVLSQTLQKKEKAETKKCKKCLRRVKIDHSKCPVCGYRDFVFDSVGF